MKTMGTILMEYAEQLSEELDELFEVESDELEIRLRFNYAGAVGFEVYRTKTRTEKVELEGC